MKTFMLSNLGRLELELIRQAISEKRHAITLMVLRCEQALDFCPDCNQARLELAHYTELHETMQNLDDKVVLEISLCLSSQSIFSR